MSGTTLVVVVVTAVLALSVGGIVGCFWATTRERARAAIAGRDADAALRRAEAEARGAQAATEELRRQLDLVNDRVERLDRELADSERARAVADTQAHELRRNLEEQQALVARAESKMGDAFRALAAEALAANNEGFLSLAAQRLERTRIEGDAALESRQKAIETLLAPLRDSLQRFDGKIQDLEKDRHQQYGQLTQLVQNMSATQERLQTETGNLARALRAPTVRGRWGELQLRRVVELAGMVEHCDFQQQETFEGEEGRLRPDLVVRLPGGRQVVVDAKVPLDAYLGALEATTDDERREKMAGHAAAVRSHIQKLGAKAYWAELPHTPEFVVMFLPSETIYGAALQETPGLIEEGVQRRVLLATPTTLIALLQTVHFGWRQERLAENAQRISEQGRLVHERLATLVEHWDKLGSSLKRATEHFNSAAASFDSRVLPAVRRLEELGAGSKKQIAVLPHVEVQPRVLVPIDDDDDDTGHVLPATATGR